MPSSLKKINLILLVFMLTALPCNADGPKSDCAIETITEHQYRGGDEDSKEKSRAIALFDAKLKAVSLAAKYLMHKGLLEHYGKRQSEVFCLTTDEITVSIVYEKFDQETRLYDVKIKSEVTSLDFIKAQNKDAGLEKIESAFSYSEEMEQPVSEAIEPAKELSRAYRYIGKEQWRIAIIYLNRLQKKYPRWGDIFLAKAIAFFGMDDIDNMVDALKSACSLNNRQACQELAGFSITS
jgi:hypothetical protein